MHDGFFILSAAITAISGLQYIYKGFNTIYIQGDISDENEDEDEIQCEPSLLDDMEFDLYDNDSEFHNTNEESEDEISNTFQIQRNSLEKEDSNEYLSY